PQSKRTFVPRVDFVTTIGHGEDGRFRAKPGSAKGPTKVITDLCVFEPESATSELIVTSLHPGIVDAQVREATGWPVRFASSIDETPAPSSAELSVLRELHARTAVAHGAAR